MKYDSSKLLKKNVIGDTPCHLAARQGYENIVNFFLKTLGQDPKSPDKHGCTVEEILHAATVKGHLCTQELALHRAASNGYPAAIKYLINKKKYDPNGRDTLQRTPLHYAVMQPLTYETLPCITFLLEAGSDILAEDVFHNLAIHNATALGHLEIVKCLLEHGSSSTTRGVLNMTPLDIAKDAGHTHIHQFLLNYN